MLVNDNEYGAPWNDQFYLVTYKEDDEVQKEIVVLDGPKKYDDYDLKEMAQGMFPSADIINIEPY